jgi:hypothetical protein
MSDEQRDVLALIVTLLVMPLIVHVLHAPFIATAAVAIACWPPAVVGCVLLYVNVRDRREQRR